MWHISSRIFGYHSQLGLGAEAWGRAGCKILSCWSLNCSRPFKSLREVWAAFRFWSPSPSDLAGTRGCWIISDGTGWQTSVMAIWLLEKDMADLVQGWNPHLWGDRPHPAALHICHWTAGKIWGPLELDVWFKWPWCPPPHPLTFSSPGQALDIG